MKIYGIPNYMVHINQREEVIIIRCVYCDTHVVLNVILVLYELCSIYFFLHNMFAICEIIMFL